MGILLTKLAEAMEMFQSDTPTKVLMLGLDAAGKTTILYKVKLNETVTSIPTIGFNVETVTPVKGLSFTVWDIGGQEKIRTLWNYYYANTEGLFFIVDSADRTRLAEAKEELHAIVKSPQMGHVPVVVIANKQDLPGAATTAEVADALGVRDMRDRKWHVQGACATNGDGIFEGMHEMATFVKEFKRQYSR